jgi:hypothetical protein
MVIPVGYEQGWKKALMLSPALVATIQRVATLWVYKMH